MYKILFSISLLCTSLLVQAQQELGLQFMPTIVQSSYANPANLTKYQVNVALPSQAFDYFNPDFKLDQLLVEDGNGYQFDPTNYIGQLKENGNRVTSSYDSEFFALSLRFKKFQISLNHRINVDVEIEYPRSMMSFLWEGNAGQIGETMQIAPNSLSFQAYHETGIGVAVPIGDKLTVGGRLKYLSGMALLRTDRLDLGVYTNPEYYQLTLESDIALQSSGVAYSIGTATEFALEEFKFFGKNRGMGIDLGANFQINERFKLGASILDLGSITWQEQSRTVESKASFTFDGFDIDWNDENTQNPDFQTVLDSIQESFSFSTSTSKFSTNLPTKLYINGVFSPFETLHLGAVAHGQFLPSGKFSPAFALSVQKEIGHWFSIGAIGGIREGAVGDFGINTSLRLGGIQFYALTDNLISAFNPTGSRHFNARVGMNLAFGKDKFTKNKDDEEKPADPLDFYDRKRG